MLARRASRPGNEKNIACAPYIGTVALTRVARSTSGMRSTRSRAAWKICRTPGGGIPARRRSALARSTRSRSMPTSSAFTLPRLRTKSPALTSSTTERAVCTTSSPANDRGCRWPPSGVPALSQGIKSVLRDCRAGAIPARTPVSTMASIVNARTRRSTGPPPHSMSGRSSARTNCPPQWARISAVAAANDASSRASQRSCRSRRRRPIPRASRTAISRRRRRARTRRRFAEFAQAISRTTAETPTSQRETRAARGMSSGPRAATTGPTRTRPSGSCDGPCRLATVRRNTAVASALALSCVLPGANLAIDRTHQVFGVVCQSFAMTRDARAPIGTQTSTLSRSTPLKPGGATPITVSIWLSIRSCRPRTSRAPPKSRCQYPWLSTATGAPTGGRSSSSVKKRPSKGRTPSRW